MEHPGASKLTTSECCNNLLATRLQVTILWTTHTAQQRAPTGQSRYLSGFSAYCFGSWTSHFEVQIVSKTLPQPGSTWAQGLKGAISQAKSNSRFPKWKITNGEKTHLRHFSKPRQYWYLSRWFSMIIAPTAVCTSSTAQGGGGSFKNRKPIGEIGCCESRMAEHNQLMDRKVVGVVFFGMVAMVAAVTWSVTSPTTAGCGVV